MPYTKSEPVSRMSVKTIHPPNEHDNIFKRLDKPVCDAEGCDTDVKPKQLNS